MIKKSFYLLLVFLLSLAQYAFADVNDDLFAAVEAGDVAEVKRAIAAGADINAIHTLLGLTQQGVESGYKANGTVLIKAASEQKAEIVKVLIDAGADLNVLTTAVGSGTKGWTALMTAAEAGYVECARLLIEAGADLEVKDTKGQTIAYKFPMPGLDLEDTAKRLEIGRLLIEAGMDLNAKTPLGMTPLMYVSSRGYEEFVRLYAVSDLNVTEKYGRTALMMAADNRHPASVKALIELGADLNVEDRFGYTALTLAQDKGHKEIVDLLTAAGAR